MDKDKYLKVLGLSDNPSEEEIRKAYRRLAVEHHPDNYMQAPDSVRLEHEEKMKEINEAYDYFIKSTLDSYRAEIINKMRSYCANEVSDLKLFSDVKEYVEDMITFASVLSSKDEIDAMFKRFLTVIKKMYESYEVEFYKDNYIDEKEVKATINYNCNVEEFYKQLTFIKIKYSKKTKFESRVAQEIAPYKLYTTCTKHLWILISEYCTKRAVNEAKESNFVNTEEAINNMHKEIKDLFKSVDEINELFNNIGKELEEVNDESLNQEYNEIKQDYDGGISLDDTQRKLISLKGKVEKQKQEQMRLNKMKEDEPTVNSLYSKLVGSYSNALLSLNPVVDNDRIKDITEFWQIVMNLFVRYNGGLIDLDKLSMLDNITFTNMIKDKELLNAIIFEKSNNSERLKIYLKRKPYCNIILDDSCFFVLREENGKYFMRKMLSTDSEEQKISVKTLEREYISLDEVMNTAIYQGYTCLYANFNKVQNLYELNVDGDYRYITLNNGRIGIANYGILSNPIDGCSDEYRNKEYFMDVLQEQINDDLQEKRGR